VYVYRMTNWASKTNYEKLFSECYWGRFPLIGWTGHNNSAQKEIYENRNTFASEYRLKKALNYTARGQITIKNVFKNTLYEIERQNVNVDHIEYYDTGYSVVCITSHYCSTDKEPVWVKYGFRKIYPLYDLNQTTFLMELFYDRKYE
jgi:hypothetical protein